jgi:hypothetical protein
MRASFIKRIDGCFAAINTQLVELETLREEMIEDFHRHSESWQQSFAGIRLQVEIDLLESITEDLSMHLQELDQLTAPVAPPGNSEGAFAINEEDTE